MMPRLFLLAVLILTIPSFAQEKKNGKVTITNNDGSVTSGKNKKGKRVGKWTTVAQNGKLLEVATYSEGIYDGYYAKYAGTGALFQTGNYAAGKRSGTWYQFSAQSDTTRIENYRNDTLHGYYHHHDFSGNKITGEYVYGKKEGLWITAGTRSNQVDSSYYVNDQLHGTQKRYKDGWLLAETTYRNGKAHGTGTIYHYGTKQVSMITHYTDGQLVGEAKEYFPDGRIKRNAWYQSSEVMLYDSTWELNSWGYHLSRAKRYTADGKPSFSEVHRESGALEWRQYYGSDGVLDSALDYHHNGAVAKRRTGNTWDRQGADEKHYAPNGKLISRGTSRHGMRDGVWVFTDSVSGKKTKEITYLANYATGSYKSFYPNGKLKVAGVCRDGYLRDSIRVYSSTGVLLKEGSAQYDEVFYKTMSEENDILYFTEEAVTTEGEDDIVVAPAEVEHLENDDEIYSFAEVMPSFPGDTLQKYLLKNIRYPEIQRDGLSGTVYMQFIVEKDGSITNIKALKEVRGAPQFTTEAVRLISTMPRWNPGQMNGRPVRVYMTIPIKFVMQ